LSILTINNLFDEGYTTTDNINKAIYILADGSLWNGAIEYGSRCNDHREAESFSKYDRYDGNKFWNDITVNMGLIMLVPENKEILINPNYTPTNEQEEKINEAVSEGYTIEDFS
jgi:hypothetical protein